MLPNILGFVNEVITPEHVTGKDVLEAGALDVNGSARSIVEALNPKSYLGTDMLAGPGVDQVCLAEDLTPLSADLVICTEMLEHARYWRSAMLGMTLATRPGGYLLITTPAPGFPFHPYPDDFWRFTPEMMAEILTACGMDVIRCERARGLGPNTYAFARRTGKPVIQDLAAIQVAKVIGRR